MSVSVLVLSAEPVDERMAGPAIRAAELARALAGAGCRATLAAPAGGTPGGAAPLGPGVRRLDAGFEDFDTLLAAAREHDVVVAQELPPTLLGRLQRLPVRVALDLYNPVVVEVLEAVAGEPLRAQRRIQELIGMRALAQCAVADFMICASERQRDLWLGGMAMHGLIDLDAYRRDPTLRSLIDVVPFGIPDEPPPPAGPERVLKGAWPEIARDDRVLLWAGGIWGWLDPATPIRAMRLLEGANVPTTHLVFLGTRRPGIERTGQERYAEQARERARRERVEGRLVHFNDGWVPYAERARWLAEADLGVSAHLDHLEARFSFRTRILDYLWAGLPVVTSAGDALGDLVEGERVGRAVAPGDADAFAAACAELLDDADGERARIEELAPSLRWSEVTKPLTRWCERAPELPPRRSQRGVLRRAIRGQYLHTLPETVRTRGAAAAARQVGRRLRRALGTWRSPR
jgi:glycosyltransferase involved in cell wall biosynthesis